MGAAGSEPEAARYVPTADVAQQSLLRVAISREWLVCSWEWLRSSIPRIVLASTCPVMYASRGWPLGEKNAPNDAGGFSSSAIPVRLANYYFRTHQPIQGPDDTDGVLSDDEEGAEGDDGTTIA